MVGHVEGVEAGASIAQHRRRGGLRVERSPAALHVGDLPKAGHDPADFEIRRKQARRRSGGRLSPAMRASSARTSHLASLALSALTSSVLISPTVVTLPSVIFHSRKGR